MCKTVTVIVNKEIPNSWQSRTYYQQSKNNVTLEVKATRINYYQLDYMSTAREGTGI